MLEIWMIKDIKIIDNKFFFMNKIILKTIEIFVTTLKIHIINEHNQFKQKIKYQCSDGAKFMNIWKGCVIVK